MYGIGLIISNIIAANNKLMLKMENANISAFFPM